MSERLSKEEAAKYLGVSVRALERYTQGAQIGVHRERVPGQAKPAPRYDRAELDRFKAEVETVKHQPAVQVLAPPQQDENRLQALGSSDETALQVAQAIAAHVTSQVLEQVLAAQAATNRQDALEVLASRVVLAEKLLLTLEDCATLTGLSKAHLRAAVTSGELGGRKIGRSIRVRREELEKWVRETC